MVRLIALFTSLLIVLAACAPPPPQLGADGKPLPRVYRIRAGEAGKIQFRMLDSVNALRSAAGLAPLSLNAKLNAAAATHARDMSLQNRPWHYGSDASTPLDRIQRVGYEGTNIGENISESYETELETLAAWMDQDDTRRTVLMPDGRHLGFSWHQESNGKLWWVLIVGS